MTAASIGAAAEALGLKLTTEERYQLAADGNMLLKIVQETDATRALEDEPAGFEVALARHAPSEDDAEASP